MTRSIHLLLAFSPLLSYAFSDTLPVVAWSSHRNLALDNLPLASAVESNSLLQSLLFNDALCDHDAVLLIEQPGLHASDLRTLHPDSTLVNILKSAPSSRQFPYVKRGDSSVDFMEIASSISSLCQSRVSHMAIGQDEVPSVDSSKHVIYMTAPHLTGTASSRKNAMAAHETMLSAHLAEFTSIFSSHLIIYTGSFPTLHHAKRQVPGSAPPTTHNSTSSNTGGILKNYQILTPGLITVLLITFFLITPIVMFGFNALASIQSPLRVEAPKGFSAHDRKNQ